MVAIGGSLPAAPPGIGTEATLIPNARKPVYKIVNGTMHIIYHYGNTDLYFRRFDRAGNAVGDEEKVPGISWMTDRFNAAIQNPNLAYRNGTIVIAPGDNAGFLRIAIRKNGYWVHAGATETAPYRKLVDENHNI